MWVAHPVFSKLQQCRLKSAWGIVMAVIFFGLLSSVRGVAATPDGDGLPHYPLNLTRGPLNVVLKDFAFQTGLQVARLSDEGSTSVVVGPLEGRFSATEALTVLLSGTGLTWQLINQHTVAVVPVKAPAPRAAAVPEPRSSMGTFIARLAAIFTVCAGSAVATNPACAQEAPVVAPPPPLEEVVVTGTSIRGVAPTGSELISVSRADIDATAAATGTELLRSIPQMGNFNSIGVNTGSNQANFVDQPNIHGIGAGNGGAGLTLLLFDGHRLPGAGINQSAPDAGVIPTSAIERVEVMADGGSSVYGSDAVAGVLNFVTRRDFNGAQTNVRHGFGDNYHTDNFSQLLGKTWETGSVLFDYEYSANAALNGLSRPYIINNQTVVGGPDTRSSVCTPANITAGAASFALSAAGAATAGGTNHCESNSANDLYPRQWRNQFYLSLRQQLGDTVEVYASSIYSGRSIQDRVSGAGVTSGALSVTVPDSSPFYLALPGVAAGTPETVTYDPGAFTNRIKTTTSSTVAGADIKLGSAWNARVELNYGLEHDTVNEFGVNAALAQAAAAAGTFNPYGVGPATDPAVIAAINNFATNYSARQVLKEGEVKLDGPLFDVNGGAAKAALGVDFRQEEFDGSTVAEPSGGSLTPYQSDGKRNSSSVFAEVFFPLIADAPLARKLDLSVAGRYDHYSDVGGTTNPKVGLNWTVVDGVLVRASVGRSFHAPSLADAPSAIDTRAIHFPCTPGAFIGCAAATPNDYTVILAGGNNLKPETARTYNFGVDLAPAAVAGLKASLTYFRVDYNNVITFPTFAPVTNPDTAYSQYRTARPAGATDAQWLAIIQPLLAGFRHDGVVYPDTPTLPTAVYDLRRQNFADEKINGLDYDLDYKFDTGFGVVNADLAGTQFMTFYQRIPGVSQVVQLMDTNYAVRTRMRGQIGWSFGQVAASLFENYTGKYRNTATLSQGQVASFLTTDAHVAWTVPAGGILDKTEVSLDANNLFDKRPPVYFTTGTNGVVGFDPAVSSALGRVVFIGFHKTW
jgi:iron complex outermembrane recepter protein